ncbi:transporter substrate-binding domain-containing protein, partial [Arcobacteraceae bacterium]|nr:transporter substrate-binding domain-containing protein [Arcobacteraceae bacterium]
VTTDLLWLSKQAKNSGGTLKVTGGIIADEPYGMGIAENESNFRDAVNFAIQKSVTDGTYTTLYIKWFGEKPAKLPEVWPN